MIAIFTDPYESIVLILCKLQTSLQIENLLLQNFNFSITISNDQVRQKIIVIDEKRESTTGLNYV